ncbi:MAG: pilin [Acidobacteriaceae bacterium]
MKKLIFVAVLAAVAVLTIPSATLLAQGLVPTQCQRGSNAADIENCNSVSFLVQMVVNVINRLLQAAGVVAILFVLYGGMRMMLSGGNPSAIAEGKSTTMNALLGLVIVFTSYIIIQFVVQWMTQGQLNLNQLMQNFI